MDTVIIRTYQCLCQIQQGRVVITKKEKQLREETYPYDELRKLTLKTQEVGEANKAIRDICENIHPEGAEFSLELQYIE